MTTDATCRAGPTGRPAGLARHSFHCTDLYCGPVSSTAWGYGLMTAVVAGAAEGAILDTWYPEPALGRPSTACRAATGTNRAHRHSGERQGPRRQARGRADRNRPRPVRRPTSPTPTCACTCSRTGWCGRTVSNLDGIFGVLTNVVWTTAGPCARRRLRATRLRAPAAWPVAGASASTSSPAWSTTCCPTGVRIADADRVRLGAHLAVGHHGHARGLRQLQRRHARRLDGRGPDLGRRRGRRRLRRRRRRVDHGHAVRRRQGR